MIKDNTVTERILWNKDKNRFMVFRVTRTYNYDEIQQKKLGHNPIAKTETWHELSVLGENEPKKKIIIPIVLKKTAIDTFSLEQLTAYFTQDLEINVLNDDMYAYQYLVKCENRAFINYLDVGVCKPVVLSGDSQAGIMKTFIGREKRLSEAEALNLIDSGIPVYEKIGSEFRMLV